MSQRKRHHLGLWASFPLAICVACSDPDYGSFDRTWETEHVTYKSRTSDATVCEGAAQSVEKYVTVLSAFLGLAPESVPHFTYYKYESVDAMQATDACPADASGCANREGVWDVRPVDGHELTHVLMKQIAKGHAAHLLMIEGLATALSCQPFHAKHDVMFVPHWKEWDSGMVALDQYEVAGKLVTAMAYLGGLPAVLDLYQRSNQSQTIAELDKMVVAVLGRSLDEIWNMAQTRSWPYCYPVYACSGSELRERTTELSVGCSGYDAVTLPNRPDEVVRLRSSLELQLTRCQLSVATPPELGGTTEGFDTTEVADLFVQLPAAPMALTFDGPEDVGAAARVAEIEMTYTPDTLAKSCEQATPIGEIESPGLAFRISPLAGPRVIAFTQSVNRQLFVSQWVESPPGSVQWCQTCVAGALTDCAPIASGERQMVSATAGTRYLEYQSDANTSFYEFLKVEAE